MKKALIIALFAISAGVAIHLLVKRQAPWALVSLYWVTLAAKNALDVKDSGE